MKKLLLFIFSLSFFYGISQTTTTTSGEYTISILKANSKNSDFGPAFYTSEKLIFSSARGNLKKTWDNGQPFLDLYEADIDGNGQISNVKNLSTRLNSKYHESNVAFSPYYKTVYFTRNNKISEKKSKTVEVLDNKTRRRGSKTKLQKKAKETYLALYRADVTVSGEWKNIAQLPFNSPSYSVGHPTVSRDGKKLYFVSDMPGSYGGTDVFVVDIKEDGTFSKPKNLGRQVNTSGKEMFPFIDVNNILYFASDSRIGGFGGLDIYAVKVFEDSFSEVIHLPEPINTDTDDFAFIIDKNSNNGYFSSNRKGGMGDDDIYHFVANPPLQFGCDQLLVGVVKDDNGKLLKGVNISIVDSKGKEVGNTLTKNDGTYKIDVPCDSKLKITGTKTSYLEDEKQLVTKDNLNGKATVNLQLNEIVICKQTVKLLVNDIRTEKPISYAMVTVYDVKGKKIAEEKATKRGNVKLILPCEKEFRIVANKDKYDENEMMLTTNGGGLSQTAALGLKLAPDLTEIKILKDKVVVNINPIYFPLNSAAITPTAAIELDKVVKIMRKYPKLKIEGGSHTDSRGGSNFNFKLSYKRAASTVRYIINQGIDSKRIIAKGYGESQPVNGCVDGVKCSEKEYQLNRRTEFVILNPDVLEYY